MKFWEEEKFGNIYPKQLTKQEKADIKSALLQQLANGKTSLQYYLENLKILSEYPESN